MEIGKNENVILEYPLIYQIFRSEVNVIHSDGYNLEPSSCQHKGCWKSSKVANFYRTDWYFKQDWNNLLCNAHDTVRTEVENFFKN